MNYYRKINNKIMWQVYDKLIHDFIRKKKRFGYHKNSIFY